MFLAFLPAVFFGWTLGRNDAANIYGTTVTSGILKYRSAALISSFAVLVGAILGGAGGMQTLSSLSSHTLLSASVNAAAAGISVLLLNRLGLPVSSSQAVVGSVVGIGLLSGSVDWLVVLKIVSCWITTPLVAAIVALFLYRLIGVAFKRVRSILVQDILLKSLAVIVGGFGSFALGANNVANITGTFADIIGVEKAVLIGGLSISAGAIMFSKRVMYTIGTKIVALESFASVIALLAQSLTVLIYAFIGVPVSVSQAIVGAVIGVGLARGSRNFDARLLKRIVFGWVSTPVISGLISVALYTAINSILALFGS
ncbi:inorganic phosphate transporter [Mesotoga sp. B105.6.4]|uniref:inorganic phosphate transporter n=1 Tax=Mesotoga sp. B105.6.4 TaxID=1582224 RepID=UPI000CAE67BD|nr:inorganic phosphate transporter [Mesotoga sp. B105.6.4]MDD3460862.1 inorganic phosphate transporter [Mesotoga sp.]PNQ05473.1 phosphate permease [Mesotoga sp. SC_NapDC3]PNS40434.1 phosphate permease [Mesotoga sp. B105.6.4]PXF34549.1 phosphate permease [Mesotoga sp. SC_NapDC]